MTSATDLLYCELYELVQVLRLEAERSAEVGSLAGAVVTRRCANRIDSALQRYRHRQARE